MDLTLEEQAELERLRIEFEAVGGRGVELADRIDRLTQKAEWYGEMGCPDCGSTNLATMEKILGSAYCTVYEDGELEYDGETKMHWDSSETYGIECMDCNWEYEGDDFPAQLKRPWEAS